MSLKNTVSACRILRISRASLYRMTDKEARRFWSKVNKTDSCWLWTSAFSRGGYGSFWFHGKPAKAHRLAWIAERGPIPGGQFVLHRCDTPACVRPDHLFLGTDADNFTDSMVKGRRNYQCGTMPLGETHSQSKLSVRDVQAIRRARAETSLSLRALASQYGVSDVTIFRITNGTLWAWLK